MNRRLGRIFTGRGLRAGCALLILLGGCSGDHPQRIFEKGVGEEQAGRLAEAQQLFHQVLARDPNHVEALEHSGNVHLRQNQRNEAFKQYNRVVALVPNRLQAVIPLARIYLEGHQFPAAETVLQPWAKLKNPPPEIRLVQADLAYQKNDFTSARKILDSIAREKMPAVSDRARS